jgi:Zn-dependent protease with chaperone function
VKMNKPLGIFYFLTTILLLTATGCNSNPRTTTSPNPQATRDPNLEKTIEKQLETMNPDAVSVYREATAALDLGDNEKSRELYGKVLSMAPSFATAYRRLGYIELKTNNIDHSVELLRKAVELEPNAYNQSALANSLIQKNTPKDYQEAFELSSTAAKSLPDDEQAISIWLLSAGAVRNIDAMRQADEHLLQIAPNNPLAHYFAGLLAADAGNWEKAETELLFSQQLGMPPENVQSALKIGIARNAMLFRLFRWGSIAIIIWLFGLGALFLTGTILSKATMQALNDTQPAINTQVKPEEHRVRSIYRMVITLLSLYYYISIPFVILILLLVVGGAFYLFLLAGVIPIQLAVLLVVMLVGSLFAILRSLFSKSRDIPLGRPLRRTDAPELWTLVVEVASKLAIRPMDAIFITPGVGIAVNEKGSILKKMRGGGQRNLILGMGALSGLTQGQFAAILAHEYGHFSNRDTAGGNLAYQVYASLHQMAQRLIQSRAAYIFNPAWLFILGYQRIYLRVTQGASRLQEILADRYAATTYGSKNFIEGLQNLIRQSIAFPLQANYEIRHSLELNRPIVNLYDLPLSENLSGELGEKFEEAMKRTTSEYDSHPALQERIAWIERLHIQYYPIQDNPKPALLLFPNPEDLQREMTSQITRNIRSDSQPA